ncbi:hypothetical protein IRJ41_002698 [Triplophysa rosa]|uniref:BEN domain-containing protein n=1 Tax=Triplophysa rosa TaxID=992332 RepID=A0A9W7WKX7_TRIRA|nr:hypothetical protein IRJ41_002698 [Triplophysa rosa]
MNVEKEATLRAAERELYPGSMPGKRARKAKFLDFGDEDTSTGNKASGFRQAEEELLSEDSQFRAESSSQENNDLTRDLQSQIKALQKENTKLRNMVKIGNDGTVTVSSHCWGTVKACTTPNGMARVLLMGLFSVDVLLKSNLKGGVSNLDPSAARRQALDPKKLQALQDAVVNQFPTAKEADVRKSINSRICELRHQVKCKSVVF